ncbi:MAG: hypothetical protein ACFFBD_19345 [Candidatus Hodarchaeota archaeon]
MKRHFGYVLILFILMGLSNIPPASGIAIGDIASWEGKVVWGGSSFTLNADITILNETSTDWTVNLTKQYNFGLQIVRSTTEQISKTENLGGLPVRAGGGYWALWINLLEVNETSGLTVASNLTGLWPDTMGEIVSSNIYAPYTFEVEAGAFTFSNKTYNVWAFMTKYFGLIYDASTGLLLALRCSYPSSTTQVSFGLTTDFSFDLKNSTFSGTESFDGFTTDVLVVPFGVFILGTVLWRKRKTSRDTKPGGRREDRR